MNDPAYLDTLSEFLAETRLADLPEAVLERARWVTADTIAAIAGGSAEPEIQALTASTCEDSRGPASVLGTGRRTGAGGAAFLNGAAGTFLELDEGNQFSRGHPAIHALPAALAFAEAHGLSGAHFTLALVLGYEVGARIGIGANIRMSMHPHGTWGTVGAAVAVAKLAGATAAQLKQTINVASTLGLGTSRQTMLQGGTVRNAFAGYSGRIGLDAWNLVSAGFTGERDGLGTVWGSVLSDRWRADAMTEALGARYEIARNYFKRHACCRYNHGALDALARIRTKHAIDPARVEAIGVETYSLAAQLDDRRPINTLGGKFSVPFAVATTLVHGSSGLASFTWDAVRSETVQSLAARVTVREDPAFTAMMPDYRPARVVVEMKNGERFEAMTRTNRGDTEDPYSQAELEEKFLELAGRVWQPGLARDTLERALGVDGLADVNQLTAPLAAAG